LELFQLLQQGVQTNVFLVEIFHAGILNACVGVITFEEGSVLFVSRLFKCCGK
jgi:hypothetical protein